jgi:hypothetical protein
MGFFCFCPRRTPILCFSNQLLISSHRKNTTENTVFPAKYSAKYLQVKKLRIMFVSESNNPLENDESDR